MKLCISRETATRSYQIYLWHNLSWEAFHCSDAKTCNWMALTLSRRLALFLECSIILENSASESETSSEPECSELSESPNGKSRVWSSKVRELPFSVWSCPFESAEAKTYCFRFLLWEAKFWVKKILLSFIKSTNFFASYSGGRMQVPYYPMMTWLKTRKLKLLNYLSNKTSNSHQNAKPNMQLQINKIWNE